MKTFINNNLSIILSFLNVLAYFKNNLKFLCGFLILTDNNYIPTVHSKRNSLAINKAFKKLYLLSIAKSMH
jgi:hypothetical protein